MTEVKIIKVTGEDIRTYLDDLARLRIEVFREFPYLYEGDLDYEREYLSTYTQASYAALIVALADHQVVGASSCLPLEEEVEAIRLPLSATTYAEQEIMYLGESVLLKQFRGHGIGVAFFRLREAYARSLGRKYASFCAVVRPEDHPQRPANYQPLTTFWQKRGYAPLPRVAARLQWKDVGLEQETPKTLGYWIKAL